MSTNPNVNSIASFSSAPFDYNELYASETISRSAQITGFAANSVAKRGTVLFGAAPGLPDTSYSNSGSQARAILAMDVTMPATGPGNALVYIQGKFLESGMFFSAAGPAADAAQLWQFGIYVLDVMDRNGLMVPLPLDALVQKEGPPEMDDESRKKALEREIAAIKAAGPQPPPRGPDSMPRYRHHPHAQPAWAEAAFDNAVHEEPLPVDPRAPGYRPPLTPPLHGSTDPGYGQPAPAHGDHEHAIGKHPEQHDVSKHSDHEPKHVDQPKSHDKK